MTENLCPICYEVRSAVIQTGFGVIYPMFLAPLSSFMVGIINKKYKICLT